MTQVNLQASKKRFTSPIFWLATVSVVALIERVLIILLYQPISYSDTASYRRLADSVLQGFSNYDGTRTPGYPIFLALAGTDQRVWLVQLLLGFITTLLLFFIAWKLTDKPWFGGLIALAHTLNLGQLFFESNLITESLTTFLLVLTMTGVFIWLFNPKRRSLWLVLFISLTSTLTLLVRPLFIYLPFYVLIFLLFFIKSPLPGENPGNTKDITAGKHFTAANPLPWRYRIAFFIPVILLLGGWMTYIHSEFGEWSLTTMTGYHLVQHTGNFFEYVPDEYASLRDTYIKYRDAHIAKYGTQTNAIWDAIPEMSQVSGYSFYALSRVLTRISINLILEHPLLFMESALSGWCMFWRTSVYWSADALRLSWLAGGLKVAILVQRGILVMINIFFIIASIYFGITEGWSTIRSKIPKLTSQFTKTAQHSFLWFLADTIWIASILQTLLDHGDNPRFLVPLQSLVVLWAALFILQLVIRKQKLSTSESGS